MFVLDTDGFVIPSLGIGDPDQSKPNAPVVEASKPSFPKVSCKGYHLIDQERKQKRKEKFVVIDAWNCYCIEACIISFGLKNTC